MGKPTGFLEYERQTSEADDAPGAELRISRNFISLCLWKSSRQQGARCMACGVPFCQSWADDRGHGLRLPPAQSGSGVE